MPAFDTELQKQLDQLWFRLPDAQARKALGIKDDELGLRQQWLIRIFQSCAKEPNGARDDTANPTIDAERLRQLPLNGNARLAGDSVPHGTADSKTRTAIAAWCSDQARLRCPVIFQARRKIRKGDDGWGTIAAQGFAFHDELRDKLARVFVRDFTGRFELLPDGKPPLVTVGMATSWGKTPVWGVRATANHSLPSVGLFDPEHVIGKPWEKLSAIEKSNFRVVAALANVEADGVIDGINAYDSSVLSAGPYHYTAYPPAKPGKAEFGAFVAYWATRGTSEYAEFRDSIGVGSAEPWGIHLQDTDHRIYTANLGLVDQNRQLIAPPAAADRNYIRTYHLFYRLQMALRSSVSMRAAFWPYARQRLADLLSTEWTAGAPPGASKIGDVFKSERSVALLARWHVFRPGHVVTGGAAGTIPNVVVAKAKLAQKPVAKWTATDEAALAQAFLAPHIGPLKTKTAARLTDTLTRVDRWRRPEWAEPGTPSGASTLRTVRDFELDVDDLPFPPPHVVEAK